MNHNGSIASSLICWNKACAKYGKANQGNIVKFGRTGSGTQRYLCKTCKKTFVENRGTVFYRRRHSQETILECLAMLAAQNSLASIHRVKGISEETVIDWLHEAANHIEEMEELILANYQLTRDQLDSIWSYVGHKSEKVSSRRAIEVVSSRT